MDRASLLHRPPGPPRVTQPNLDDEGSTVHIEAEDTIILHIPGAAAAVCWAAHRNRSEMWWTELGETWRQCILPVAVGRQL